MEVNTLNVISPIDGRYIELTKELEDSFSEYALIKNRIYIEIRWLIQMFKKDGVFAKRNDLDILKKEDIKFLEEIVNSFDLKEAMRVKEIEAVTKHDVKAVEYYIREKLEKTNLEKYISFIHFGCTSEDINNLAYGLMVKNGIYNVWFKNAKKLVEVVRKNAVELKDVPMLGHTHGQIATPTTVGKELNIFCYRWNSILNILNTIKLRGKFSGAVGNFNAHIISYPDLDWFNIAKEFVEELGLEFNPLTTQIESHDILSVVLNLVKSFNNITMDFNSDMWMYISLGYFKQKVISTEVGSSVMPHKVNPINHENSMANIRLSNGLVVALVDNLPISRMQRDLSDSSMLRNIGSIIAYSLISIKQSIIGINKMMVDKEKLLSELNDNPEVLAEAIQMVLRKNGDNKAYEELKTLTRGKSVTLDMLGDYIKSLNINEDDKNRLLKCTPETYIGLASKLVEIK